MRRMGISLGLALALTAAAACVTLAKSPVEVIAANTSEQQRLELVRHPLDACQANEVLPADTHAVRLQILALLGPKVSLLALQSGRVITSGQRSSGWTGGSVTVPVKPLSSTRPAVELCFALQLNGDESASVMGEPWQGPEAALAGESGLPGRVRVEYLRPARSSWWSLVPAVARHMGLGNVVDGTWSVFAVVGLMASVVCLSSYMALRLPR
jgi:hypothetical protein